jgi:hypothetical protein
MKHPAIGQNGSQSRRPNALPTQKRRNNARKKWDFYFGKGIGNQRVSTNAAHPPTKCSCFGMAVRSKLKHCQPGKGIVK